MKLTPNFLKNTRCYLPGSMQYAKDGRSWRGKIKDALGDRNITFFDPYIKPFIHISSLSGMAELLKQVFKFGSFVQLAAIIQKKLDLFFLIPAEPEHFAFFNRETGFETRE